MTSPAETHLIPVVREEADYTTENRMEADEFENFEDLDTNEDSDDVRNDLRFDNESDSDPEGLLELQEGEDDAIEYEEEYDSDEIEEDDDAEFTLEGEEDQYVGPTESNDDPFEEPEVDPSIERLCNTTPVSAKRANGKKYSFSGGKSGGYETGGLLSLDLTKMLHDKKQLEKKKMPGKSVRQLILSSNKIAFVDVVEEDSISTKKHVVKVKVYFDNIQREEKLLPVNVAHMSDLNLSHNKLERMLSSSAISHLGHLVTLNLSQNKIKTLESDFLSALAAFNTVESLDLSFNEIRNLPKEIGLLTNLRTLKLKSNQLVQLPPQICELCHLSDSSSSDFDISKNQLITPKQVCAQKGGIRWIRAYFQIAYGGSASVEDTQYYNLIVSQCESLGVSSGGGHHIGGGSGNASGSSGSGKGKHVKGLHSKSHKGKAGSAAGAGSNSSGGGGGAVSEGGKSLQLMMFVLGTQSSGKSTLVHQLMNSFKNVGGHGLHHDPALGGGGVGGLGGSLVYHDPLEDTPADGPRLMRETSSSTISSTQSFASMVSRSAASTATSHSSLHRDISGATVHSSPSITYGKRSLQLQLPPSIDEDDGSMSTNKQFVEDGDIRVSHWHPKKKHLNKFLTAHKGNPNEGLTVANLTGSNSKQAKRAREYQIFEQSNDVKFAVWELGGPTCCSAINELFFHSQALYLLVWNIAQSQTNYDFDVHVQQWIDMIHARAPGSVIVIVATHCDLIDTTEANTRVANLQARLNANKERRKADLENELSHISGEERDRVSKQRRLPIIDPNIIRVTHCEKDIALIRFLACHVVRLATATADNRIPFGLINLDIHPHFLKVKRQLELMMYDDANKRDFCAVQELDDAVYLATAERKTPSSTSSDATAASNMPSINLSASGTLRPPIAPRKNRAEHLEKTRQALEHFHKVGEVLWFGKFTSNSNSSILATASGGDVTPSVADASISLSVTEDSSWIVYFRPDWLSKLLHSVLDARLTERVASKEVFSMVASEKTDKKLRDLQLLAAKGVFQWQDIREHLKALQYEPVLFESLRHLLEDSGLIRVIDHPTENPSGGVGGVPITGMSPNGSVSPTKGNLHKSISSSTLSKSVDSSSVRRNPSSYDSMQQLLNMTSVATLTNKSPSSAKSSGSSGDLPAILQTKPANPNDQKRYLIPALVPKIEEDHLQFSGYVTLERFYTFSRCVPVWLVHNIFTTVYNECRKLQRSQRDRLFHMDIYSPNVMCWENGFKQQHESVMITVQLEDNSQCDQCSTPVEPSYQPFTPFTPHRSLSSSSVSNLAGITSAAAVHTPNSGGKPAASSSVIPTSASASALDATSLTTTGKDEGYCCNLVIKGLGHMLSSQTILKYLDYYCNSIHSILQQYPGFGGAQWVSSCPQCLLHDESDENKGTFSQQEIMQIRQENNPIRMNGVFDPSQLRYLNTKRYTCKKQRCQVKADRLVQVPEEVKKAIEDTSKSEHEIHFLLDEVIRTSSRSSKDIEKSVVKILAANGIAKDVHAVKSINSSNVSGDNATAPAISILTVYPCSVSSGVVVNIPEECADIHHKYQKILVFSCEHLITECTVVDKKLKYEKKFNAHNADTIFFIGDQNQWLYVAEMIYKGSTHLDSESNWWDICVLRIIAPVKPVSTVLDSKYLRMELQPSGGRSSVLQHPSYPAEDQPLLAVKVSDKRVVVDQVVRLLGYPENGELSIDWGRIVQNNESSDIMVKLLSDTGSSGGPIVDRNGELVGLLSKSHENYKNSCVQPIRNLFELIE